MSTRPIRLIPIRTEIHRSIEAAGRAPILGWFDERREPLRRGSDVRETFDLIRKTMMESRYGENQATQ